MLCLLGEITKAPIAFTRKSTALSSTVYITCSPLSVTSVFAEAGTTRADTAIITARIRAIAFLLFFIYTAPLSMNIIQRKIAGFYDVCLAHCLGNTKTYNCGCDKIHCNYFNNNQFDIRALFGH